MSKTLEYKGYVGSYDYVPEEKEYHGKLTGITNLVTFGGKTPEEVHKSFREAVKDYIGLLDEVKEPLDQEDVLSRLKELRMQLKVSIDLAAIASNKGIVDNFRSDIKKLDEIIKLFK